MRDGTRIDFFDQFDTSKAYAIRRWPHVPRVGDTVEFSAHDEPFKFGEVTHVRWGQIDRDEQCAVVFFKWRKK